MPEQHWVKQVAQNLEALRGLSEAAWCAVASRRDKLTGVQIDVPFEVPVDKHDVADGESRFGADFPVLQHLSTALQLASDTQLAELCAQFATLVEQLHWSQNTSYNETNCESAFLDGYAYAAFSGPDGPVTCAAPRGGMMLMGPNVHYVDHRHAPKEVYLIMTPDCQWRLDEGEWFDVAPGDLIFHDSWQMHAARTRDNPMLAFAGWLEPGRRQDIELLRQR